MLVKWSSISKCIVPRPTPPHQPSVNLAVLPRLLRDDHVHVCVHGGACRILALGRIKGIKGALGAGCPGSGRGKLLQKQGCYVMGRTQLCLLLPSKATAALWTQPLAPKS